MYNKGVKILNISNDSKATVEKIDNGKFLNLDNKNTTRMELFLFAVALGLETDTPTDLKTKDTFVRGEYITTKYEAYLYSMFINEIEDEKQLDLVTESSNVYELAQRYANTGFMLLDEIMKSKPESIIELEMIAELDKQYSKIVF